MDLAELEEALAIPIELIEEGKRKRATSNSSDLLR